MSYMHVRLVRVHVSVHACVYTVHVRPCVRSVFMCVLYVRVPTSVCAHVRACGRVCVWAYVSGRAYVRADIMMRTCVLACARR